MSLLSLYWLNVNTGIFFLFPLYIFYLLNWYKIKTWQLIFWDQRTGDLSAARIYKLGSFLSLILTIPGRYEVREMLKTISYLSCKMLSKTSVINVYCLEESLPIYFTWKKREGESYSHFKIWIWCHLSMFWGHILCEMIIHLFFISPLN